MTDVAPTELLSVYVHPIGVSFIILFILISQVSDDWRYYCSRHTIPIMNQDEIVHESQTDMLCKLRPYSNQSI